MASLAFSHMAITCQDPIAVEKFYTKYFGFMRTRVIPLGEDQIVFIKSDNFSIELFKTKENPITPKPEKDGLPYPGWRHISFTVDNVDKKIAAMGDDAKITLGPLSFDNFIPGWRTVWLADPEGNIVEVSQGYVDQHDPPSLE